MMVVMKATIRPTPISTEKIVAPANADADEATAEAENSRGPLETTMPKPEREMGEVTTGRASPLKMKYLEGASSKNKELDLRHLGGQELFEEDISELKEFAIAGSYKLVYVLFGGVDEEILGCIPDRAGAKIVNT
jgi:hypothetical protein